MKKVFCMIFCLTLVMTVLVGCNNQSDHPENPDFSEGSEIPGISEGGMLSITGTDAAKLLLAEERLNEKLLKNEGDIFENGVQVMNALADKAIENLGVTLRKEESKNLGGVPPYSSATVAPLGLSVENNHSTALGVSSGNAWGVTPLNSLGDEKNDIGSMEIVGDTVVWTDLDEVSNSYEYFLNLTNNIVSEAEICADLIDFIKKNIRIVDKWVEIGNERYYLSVSENEELLCNEFRDGDNLFLTVCHRYRNADGKDVYEMYRSYGSESERRMTYIPGERYELSEGRIHHFIATNTKGYWENYVLGDEGSHYNVSYLVLKNDICYAFGQMRDDNVVIDILSADRQTDLFLYMPGEQMTSMLLKLNGFTNIEKISAPRSNVELNSENAYANIHFDNGAKIHIKSGTVIGENQAFCDGKVNVGGIGVMYYAYGYGAEMMLNIEGSPEEAVELFKQFLNETGLRCSRDINTVIAGTKKSITDSRAVFNYYQWNGYAVNTEEGIRKATNAEKTKYDEILARYREIENVEVILFEGKSPEELQLLMSFSPIVNNVSSGAKMENGRLTVDRLTLTVNDLLLFVKDEAYHVVIALEDSAGGIIHLEQASAGEVKYTGEKEFSVTANSVAITLPHLTPGTYRVVAYIATSDGIRSSKFASVAFDSVDEQSVNLGDVDLIGALDASGALTLTYIERVDVNVSIESETTLAYDGFKQLVCEQAFLYGIPDESQIEMRRDEGYVALTGSEGEIASGEYRIKYSVENGSYLRQGYVYVAYSAIPAQEAPETPAEPEEETAQEGASAQPES